MSTKAAVLCIEYTMIPSYDPSEPRHFRLVIAESSGQFLRTDILTKDELGGNVWSLYAREADPTLIRSMFMRLAAGVERVKVTETSTGALVMDIGIIQ